MGKPQGETNAARRLVVLSAEDLSYLSDNDSCTLRELYEKALHFYRKGKVTLAWHYYDRAERGLLELSFGPE